VRLNLGTVGLADVREWRDQKELIAASMDAIETARRELDRLRQQVTEGKEQIRKAEPSITDSCRMLRLINRQIEAFYGGNGFHSLPPAPLPSPSPSAVQPNAP
jgi:hypothetical protein